MKRLLRGVVATVVGVTALACGVSQAAASAPAAPTSCADVLVLGARGSGQPQRGSASDGGTGLGPQVSSAVERLRNDLPGRSVRVQSLKYPARQAELLALDPQAYFGGLERGVSNAKALLAKQVGACPRQRYVLVGYSQGAMVMHRVLQDLRAEGSSATKETRRIDAAVLLADGDRSSADHLVSSGSAGKGRGISYLSPADSRVRGTQVPTRLTSRVFSVCEQGDVICDYHSLLQTNAQGVDGTTVHVRSYTNAPNVLLAADAAARRVR